ncbi:MAG: aspartate/glutamate racemase family protein [Oceanospirillaceae bacterium]
MNNETTGKLAFLHTSAVHMETFNKLINKLNINIKVVHKVDESLLSHAISTGVDADLIEKVQLQIKRLIAEGASVVVCTCSSIGAIAEQFELANGATVLRIDRAMADKAVLIGQDILILAALQSTLSPTYDLLQTSADKLHRQVNLEVVCIDQAWSLFEAGEMEKYHQCIADYIQQYAANYDVIVLAQASMASASVLCHDMVIPGDIPILSSPELGLMAAIEML